MVYNYQILIYYSQTYDKTIKPDVANAKKNNTVIFIHVVLKIRPLFDKIKDLTADELGNVNSEVGFEQCLWFYIGR